MERERFLATVTEAITRAQLPPSPDHSPGLLVPALPDVDLVDRFVERVAAIDGEVHRDTDPADVITSISEIHGVSDYISWDPDHLPVPGLLDRLSGMGLTRLEHVVPPEPEGRLDRQGAYRSLTLGITGAEAGFAESGSVVLRSGRGRPRMASLIPLVHVVLLEEGRIHRTLPHWAAAHADDMDAASNVVFVSGPSRTGDIEQQLNLGVHGPRHVHVVLV